MPTDRESVPEVESTQGETSLGISVLPEPLLEFRHAQQAVDPHAGLALFGPYDSDARSRPGQITYGVVGRPEGVALFEAFAERITRPIVSQAYGDPDVDDRKAQLLWPPFPGFDAAFGSTWP